MAFAGCNYDVSELYTVIKPASGTKAVGKYDKTIDVETRYCHEYASFSEEVVLIIESNYGYRKGKIIFD